jgi:hypothetical protein
LSLSIGYALSPSFFFFFPSHFLPFCLYLKESKNGWEDSDRFLLPSNLELKQPQVGLAFIAIKFKDMFGFVILKYVIFENTVNCLVKILV